jgi:hypothetical protein
MQLIDEHAFLLLAEWQSLGDERLHFFLNPSKMVFPSEAFGEEFVHIRGAGGAGRKPVVSRLSSTIGEG